MSGMSRRFDLSSPLEELHSNEQLKHDSRYLRGTLAESLADPATGAPYEFAATGADRYRLCAVFATDTAQRRFAPDADDWIHAAGRGCFDRRIEPDGDRKRP